MLVMIRGLFIAKIKLKAYTIVIGNPNVGGSGKTPFALWLVQELQALGFSVGVVSRGYQALYRSKEPYLAYGHYDYRWLGDEPALIGEHCGCPIAVHAHRAQAAQKLLRNHACDIVVFDDGLQHQGIDFDLKICIFNPDIALGNTHTLPGGPLRVPLSSMEGLDFI
jgi:tetraacyldisaccharide 4'-kinase